MFLRNVCIHLGVNPQHLYVTKFSFCVKDRPIGLDVLLWTDTPCKGMPKTVNVN
jgi:hypothetical protein